MKIVFISLLVSLFCCCTNAQQTLYNSIPHDSLVREYIVYIPASLANATNEVPILFVFHGYGAGNIQSFMNNKLDFRPIADTAGYILVYPKGTRLFQNNSNSHHWNVGSWTSSSTSDDVGFIDALIDTLNTNYNIDQHRIYATGHSNGGYFSFVLACQLSYRFAAIASSSGTMSLGTLNSCNPLHPTPVLQIHGTSDNTVGYNGGSPGNSISIASALDYWINYNNTDSVPVVSNLPNIVPTDGSTVELYEYENGQHCISVNHYKIIGGGHGIAGVNGNMDIVATEVIWGFVSKFDINGLIDCGTITTNEHIHENNSIKIAPNPTRGFVTIETDLTKSLYYRIYSVTGKHIISGEIDSNKTTIDLTKVPVGIYILKVNNRIVKFIKTK
jgi:polyhydroxybutyrate depolymerase